MQTYVGEFSGLPLYSDPNVHEGYAELQDARGNVVALLKIDDRGDYE